jgi:hypothetical protein
MIIETNQIAKRNYEKLDKIIRLLKKNNIEVSEDDENNGPEETH